MIETLETLDERTSTLVQKAKEMTRKSYAPYSKFNVGAAVLLDDGTIVTGANQENAAYGESVCAERVALLYATANYPLAKPVAIAIAAYTEGNFTRGCITPCGSCRQVLSEMEHRFGAPIEVIMYGTQAIKKADSVKDLLPLQFSL